MTDLVERLRLKARWESIGSEVELKNHIDWKAADKIEQLRKENEQIRKFSLDNACEAEECWDYTDELKAKIERLQQALKDLMHDVKKTNVTLWVWGQAKAALRDK